jgi:hypothetical protein
MASAVRLPPIVRTSSWVGVDVGWLLGHASDSQVWLQVAADQAGSEHTGDSRERGKPGPWA